MRAETGGVQAGRHRVLCSIRTHARSHTQDSVLEKSIRRHSCVCETEVWRRALSHYVQCNPCSLGIISFSNKNMVITKWIAEMWEDWKIVRCIKNMNSHMIRQVGKKMKTVEWFPKLPVWNIYQRLQAFWSSCGLTHTQPSCVMMDYNISAALTFSFTSKCFR